MRRFLRASHNCPRNTSFGERFFTLLGLLHLFGLNSRLYYGTLNCFSYFRVSRSISASIRRVFPFGSLLLSTVFRPTRRVLRLACLPLVHTPAFSVRFLGRDIRSLLFVSKGEVAQRGFFRFFRANYFFGTPSARRRFVSTRARYLLSQVSDEVIFADFYLAVTSLLVCLPYPVVVDFGTYGTSNENYLC